jgi:tryptophan 2,3-dioxygenase
VGPAPAAGCLTPATDADLAAGMAEFSDLLLKWRRAHFEIARRVLGGLEGTGYTEGVPYLDRVRDLPVFPRIGPEPG